MMNLLLAAITVASIPSGTPSNCYNIYGDFEGFSVPTPINQVNGWSGFGGPIQIDASVPNGNQFLDLSPQFSIVSRDLSALRIVNEFQLDFDIALDRTTSFRLYCGNGGQPAGVTAELSFDFSVQPPVVSYLNGSALAVTTPLAITPGVFTTVSMDVNVHGAVTINYGNAMLATDQWPLDCRIPSLAEWTSMGTPGSSNRLDNFCVRPAAQNACRGGTNSTGVPAKLFGIGSRSLSSGGLTLVASDLPPNRLGTIILGTAAQPTNQAGVCIAGIGGVYPSVYNSGAAGTFSQSVDWGSLPLTSGAASATAGETWHFQVYYRDFTPWGSLIARFSDRASVVVLP